MSKLITVFGATGNQGGSVIKHILADPQLSQEFKIRGVTRDASKPAAQALTKQGVQVVSVCLNPNEDTLSFASANYEVSQADMTSKDSLKSALEGTHTIFLVTNAWDSSNSASELDQGKNVVDVAKQLDVQYIIFSSLLHVTKASNGRFTNVPHFDQKADIEAYIRASGIPSAFFLPGYFMSNLQMSIRADAQDTLTWALPVSSDAKFPLIDIASDAGNFVAGILSNPSHFAGKQILGAAGYYTPPQILDSLAKITGKKTHFAQVPEDVYKSFLPAHMAQEMLENHLFIQDPGYFAGQDLDESLKAAKSNPVSWEQYIEKSGAWK